MRGLLDTNILVIGLNRRYPLYRTIRRTVIGLKRQGMELVITPRNLVEFWAVATRPLDANGLGMSVQWAAAQIQWMKRLFGILPDSAAIFTEWEHLVLTQQVSGKKVHDARLVAARNIYGVTQILTLNVQDFLRYPCIQAVRP